jgi:hypothetical protein
MISWWPFLEMLGLICSEFRMEKWIQFAEWKGVARAELCATWHYIVT